MSRAALGPETLHAVSLHARWVPLVSRSGYCGHLGGLDSFLHCAGVCRAWATAAKSPHLVTAPLPLRLHAKGGPSL